MVTATSSPPDTRPAPSERRSSVLRIPLAEFGRSLEAPDLDRWFEGFADRNSDEGQYEISNEGFLLIMPPTGNPGMIFEGELTIDLGIWARANGGIVCPPTSRFILPDGSRFGPDAAWIREERRPELPAPENLPFPRIVPDFVAEIKSPSNSPHELISKIESFIQHGARLAWYIDPQTRQVIKFRPGRQPETLADPEHIDDPEYIDGDDDVLPGFRFAVRQRIFDVFTTFEQQEADHAAGEQGSSD